MSAFLPCPDCGEDAIPSSSMGCNGEREGAGCVSEPLWTEDDGCPCPACGVELRVVVDDGHAYAEVAA